MTEKKETENEETEKQETEKHEREKEETEKQEAEKYETKKQETERQDPEKHDAKKSRWLLGNTHLQNIGVYSHTGLFRTLRPPSQTQRRRVRCVVGCNIGMVCWPEGRVRSVAGRRLYTWLRLRQHSWGSS